MTDKYLDKSGVELLWKKIKQLSATRKCTNFLKIKNNIRSVRRLSWYHQSKIYSLCVFFNNTFSKTKQEHYEHQKSKQRQKNHYLTCKTFPWTLTRCYKR